MNRKSDAVLTWLDRAAYVLLGIILFDCMALGGGSWVKVLGIDIRMILFALFFLASLPGVLKNFRKIVTNPYVALLIVWGVWLVFSTARGLMLGNRRDLILGGLIGFASFGLLPGAVQVLRSRERCLGLMKAAAAASLVLTVQTFVLVAVYNFGFSHFVPVNNRLISLELGGCTGVNDAVVRVMLRSHPLLIFGCGCMVYFALRSRGIKGWLWCAGIGAGLLALLISYTRSIYLAAFAAAALLIVLLWLKSDRAGRKKLLGVLGRSAAMLLVALLVFDLVFGGAFLSYGIYRSTGFDPESALGIRLERPKPSHHNPRPTEPEAPSKPLEDPWDPDGEHRTDPTQDLNVLSDSLRERTVEELKLRIREHPIIGSGMGAVLKVREKTDCGNEYFYLDQIFKTGIVGCVLYVAPMAMMLVQLLRDLRRKQGAAFAVNAVWMAGLTGIAVFCLLNPYLNGSNGIMLYCLCIGVMSIQDKETN